MLAWVGLVAWVHCLSICLCLSLFRFLWLLRSAFYYLAWLFSRLVVWLFGCLFGRLVLFYEVWYGRVALHLVLFLLLLLHLLLVWFFGLVFWFGLYSIDSIDRFVVGVGVYGHFLFLVS